MKQNPYNQLLNTEEFKKFELEFDINTKFLYDFSNLISSSGRLISFISPERVYPLASTILDSAVQTLNSIKLCCSIGSFSDANTLIRKLRDDLMLYVYILSIVNRRKTFTETSIQNFNMDTIEEIVESFSQLEFEELNHDEKAIKAWLGNKVLESSIKKKLSYDNYMKVIRLNDNIDEILNKYNLQEYWCFLQKKLNDYVHNNGAQFTNHNTIKKYNSGLDIYFNNINTRTSYIVTFFLVLISMIDSALLCSGDIEDYMDMGMDIPENCQYEIAPFIQVFIDEKIVKLHPELKEYLQRNNNNGMIID